MVDTLDALRQRIREIEGRPATPRTTVTSGDDGLDTAAGGLPCPGLVEVVGTVGSGRTRVAMAWAAARTRAGEPVAWIDPERVLYPPTAAVLGVDLAQLLVVRPDPLHAAWATEQVLRSGCFGLVVLAAPPDTRGLGARWQQAVRHGHTTLVLLATAPGRDLPIDLRLVVRGASAVVQRRRGGGHGQVVALPAWPEGADPWDEAGGVPWA